MGGCPILGVFLRGWRRAQLCAWRGAAGIGPQNFVLRQPRFYDLNVWSEKKRLEKLTYMHNNPVKPGLAKEPGDWPWSSWRFDYRGDASLLATDRIG